MKTIAFFSDIHIGSPDFSIDEGFAELISNGYEKIYLLGDIIDTWETSINKILKEHKYLINKIASSKNIEIIRGNHDPSINKMKKIFPNTPIHPYFLEKNIDGYRCAMIHGDKYDWALAPYRFLLSIILNPIYFVSDGIYRKDWRNTIRHWYYKTKDKTFTFNIVSNIERYTVNEYRRKGYEVLIMGHTHNPKIVDTAYCKYINCGNLVYKPSFVIYEYDKRLEGRRLGQFSIVKF
jgi:UDP-2,3-diacylglucosamine pyrophosphatase LpxH